MIDEGPSQEDLERFGGETAWCPECGAEVWDEAPACPSCGAWMEGGASSWRPAERARRARLLVAVALIAAAALLLWLVL